VPQAHQVLIQQCLDRQVPQVLLVLQGQQVHKELQAMLALQVPQAQSVPRVQQGLQALMVLQVQQVQVVQ
jgi:hypothetical protein